MHSQLSRGKPKGAEVVEPCRTPTGILLARASRRQVRAVRYRTIKSVIYK